MIATHSQLELAHTEPRLGRDDERPLIASCPICASRRLHYAFSQNDYRVVRCDDAACLFVQEEDGERLVLFAEIDAVIRVIRY